ncbi:MAG TPA: hypothetical protein VKZ50_17785 [bacterium]|nr:hypothetical protein [bacterium]
MTNGAIPRSIVVHHRDPAGREALARSLADVGRVEHAGSLPHALELVALNAAACLLVDLPEPRRERIALAQIAAAYPQTRVFVFAATLPFDAVRELVRAGVRDVLPLPLDAEACADAVREALVEETGVSGRLRGMSIAVASGKGGAGCTVLTLNLAAALSTHGAVMAVDADAPPCGTLGVAGDLDPGGTVTWLVRQRLPIEPRVLRHSATPHAAGFSVLTLWADPEDPAEMEGVVPAVLDACTAISSFVVVDVGRPVLPAQRLLLRRAALTLAVTTLDLPALRNLRRLADMLAAEGGGGAPPTLVLNRLGRDASYGADQAAGALGRPFAAVLPYAEPMRARLDRGELVLVTDPQHPWCAAVRRLAQVIVARRRDSLRNALGDGGVAAGGPGDG